MTYAEAVRYLFSGEALPEADLREAVLVLLGSVGVLDERDLMPEPDGLEEYFAPRTPFSSSSKSLRKSTRKGGAHPFKYVNRSMTGGHGWMRLKRV